MYINYIILSENWALFTTDVSLCDLSRFRALQFIIIFLQQIVADHQNATKTDNMGPFCRKAYEESLKKYHSWMVQKVFSVCLWCTSANIQQNMSPSTHEIQLNTCIAVPHEDVLIAQLLGLVQYSPGFRFSSCSVLLLALGGRMNLQK